MGVRCRSRPLQQELPPPEADFHFYLGSCGKNLEQIDGPFRSARRVALVGIADRPSVIGVG